MRHHLVKTSVAVLVFATTLFASGPAWAGVAGQSAINKISITPTPASAVSPASPASPPSAQQRVSYGGLSFDRPPGWTVVDLTSMPTTCVRFDVHVVYLGTPGQVQNCPAVVQGRTEAILLRPMPTEPPFGTIAVIPGAVPMPTSSQLLAGEVNAQLSGTNTLMTAAFGANPSLAMDVFRTLAVTAAAPHAPAQAAPSSPQLLAADPAPLDRSFTWHYGKGFDACDAPALTSMRAWLTSPYRSIGIYIGGAARGCPQANLTASWVRSVATMGWNAQPVYVGLQAPCSTFTARITYGRESTQGRDAAVDAIARAEALGIGSGSDIYLDMEAYTQSASCSGSVRAFLSSWTSTLRAGGYSSGVYSSLASGIADLANGAGQPGFVAPDKIWIASWNGHADVDGAPYVAAAQWYPYRRMHQYAGGHNEAYGAITINIDNNYLDTDPNQGSPFGQFDSADTGPSKITATGWVIDPDTIAPILVQMYIDGLANSVGWADQYRQDVGSVYAAAGPNHGYSLTMQTTPGTHRVCLIAINSGPGSSRGISCRVVNVASSDPVGQLETVTTGPGTVSGSGWAIDPNTSSPILVQMYVDGLANSVTWADQSRPDLVAYFPSAGAKHGYSLTMPTTAGSHNVCLIAINSGPGSSRGIGCRVVHVR